MRKMRAALAVLMLVALVLASCVDVYVVPERARDTPTFTPTGTPPTPTNTPTGATPTHTPTATVTPTPTPATKDVFLPITRDNYNSGKEAPTPGYRGPFPFRTLQNNEEEIQLFSLTVPDDYGDLVSVKAIWVSESASGNMYWRLAARYGAAGEDIYTHQQFPAYGVTATGGADVLNIQEPANPLVLGVLAKGDFLGIELKRRADEALDTLNNDVELYGLIFSYETE